MTTLPSTADILRGIALFSSLSDAELQRIIDSPLNGIAVFETLAPIVEENEIGDCMYVILEGVVDLRITTVDRREITFASLKAGEFFGEESLLPHAQARRPATVRARQRTRLFRITRTDSALGAIGRGDTPAELGTSELPEEERVRRMLQSVPLFRSLSRRDLARVGEWTKVVTVGSGEIIIREAESGDYLYVILEGAVEVFVVDDEGKVTVLAALIRGHYFGEQAMLPEGSGKRNANVRANVRTTLIRVAKRYFKLILGHDKRLALTLAEIGASQKKKIIDAIGGDDVVEW